MRSPTEPLTLLLQAGNLSVVATVPSSAASPIRSLLPNVVASQ
jgi:hypothetical protein